MPYTTTHLYITWGGDAWTQQEQWQTGLRLPVGVPIADGSPEDFAESVSAKIEAWFSAPGLPFSSAVRLGWTKVAHVGQNGLYIEDSWNPVVVETVPPQTGSGQTTVLPQSSVVVTLDSGFSTGRARTGRCYLPPMTSAVPGAATGLMSASAADAIRDAFVTLIDGINDSRITYFPGGDGRVSIMSSLGTGTTRPVESVRVGRVVDTQRRRRNALPETYSAPGVIPT